MAGKRNPGSARQRPGVRVTLNAATLNVISTHITFGDEMHRRLRVARLLRRYGLTGSRADLIASLAFDGGRR